MAYSHYRNAQQKVPFPMKTLKEATSVAGSLGSPSKMPGSSYGISAEKCITGSKLAQVPGSTCHGCYALKGNYIYRDVKKSHAKRLDGISNNRWVPAMVMMLKAAHSPKRKQPLPPFHRWHDSGDIQSKEHLAKIAEVAKQTPELKHWIPTRELQILMEFIKEGGEIPDNLTVRVSATMVDGPATKAWPTVSHVHQHEAPKGEVCPAPLQDNFCGACRKCWDKSVPSVSYHKH